MDETSVKLEEMQAKLDAILVSVEKTRKYFQITMWFTVVFLVVPLFLLMFVIPMFLNSYVGSLNSLDSAGSFNQSQLDVLQELLQ